MRKDRTLGQIIIALFMVVMGFLRTIVQLSIVNFDLNVFLVPPFLVLIPLTLSLSYAAAGILILISWRLGRVLSIIAIVAQVSIEFYRAISEYGIIVVTDLTTVYGLDLLVSAYLILSSLRAKELLH